MNPMREADPLPREDHKLKQCHKVTEGRLYLMCDYNTYQVIAKWNKECSHAQVNVMFIE